MVFTFIETTEHHHIFHDESDNKHSVGVEVGTWEQALELLENPPAPPNPPGIKPDNLDFEFGITPDDQMLFASDLTGFQNRIIIGEITAQDTFPVQVADKFGNRHNIHFNEYLIALGCYHKKLRKYWEQ